jgi:hypothetical protein
MLISNLANSDYDRETPHLNLFIIFILQSSQGIIHERRSPDHFYLRYSLCFLGSFLPG